MEVASGKYKYVIKGASLRKEPVFQWAYNVAKVHGSGGLGNASAPALAVGREAGRSPFLPDSDFYLLPRSAGVP